MPGSTLATVAINARGMPGSEATFSTKFSRHRPEYGSARGQSMSLGWDTCSRRSFVPVVVIRADAVSCYETGGASASGTGPRLSRRNGAIR
jgi:hypothetical protein